MAGPKKLFLLLDGRAKVGREDDAIVIVTADTEEECRAEGRTTWKDYDAIWQECNVVAELKGKKAGTLEEVGLRWDLPPVKQRQAQHPKG